MRSNDTYEVIPSGDRRRPAVWGGAFSLPEHNYTWEQAQRILRKHLRLLLAVVFGLTALTAFYAFSQRDFYRPTARLEFAPAGSGSSALRENASPDDTENQDYLETQVQILGSDALAVAVIRDLRLDKNSEFVSGHQPTDSADGKDHAAAPTVAPGELAILQEQLDLANLTLAESLALERFRKTVSVASVRNTRLVEISFSSHDPRLAQSVVNTLVTKFIDQNYRQRYTSTMQASDWLATQLTDLRNKVDKSSLAAANYQKKFGIVEVDDRDVPMSQLMNEVSRQLGEAQASRVQNEAFVRMIDEGHSDAVPALHDNKLYQDLMGRYVDLRTQLVQMKAVYGDANVNVKKLQEQLIEVSLQVEAERKRALARTRSTYDAAKNREQLMTGERDRLRSKMAQMGSELGAYHMLKTEANSSAELYDKLQGRLREAGIYAGLRSSNIRVVDLASNLHKPTGPHRSLLLSLGALGSCFVAVFLAFFHESFRTTVRTPEDVKSWVGLPSLALLPAMAATSDSRSVGPGTPNILDLWRLRNGDGSDIEIMKSLTPESEAMRDLRTSLLYARQGNAPRTFLISSSLEGEGKTTVAVNFALALAQLGKTCLVEGDLRKPGVARAFRVETRLGLTEFLTGTLSLSDALLDIPGVENLTLLPSGGIPENPSDLLSSDEMVRLVETLKQNYSFVVLDSPPVIRFSDARLLSSLVDDVILVGRYGVTTRRVMQRSAELLHEVHASVAGVVLNGIDFSSPDYDYYANGYTKEKATYTEDSSSNSSGPEATPDDSQPGAMGAHA